MCYKLLKRKFLNTSSGVYYLNKFVYFSSIHTLSIYAWNKQRQHGNFSFLKRKHKNTPINKIPLDITIYGERVYMDLLTELWAEFGQSKELLKEIELRKDLFQCNLDYLTTGDRGILNDIDLINAELSKLLKDSSQGDYNFDREVNELSKNINRSINQKQTSVFDYYALTK